MYVCTKVCSTCTYTISQILKTLISSRNFCQYLENKFVKFHYIIILSKNGILKPNQNVKRKHAHKITRALFSSAICLQEFARLDVEHIIYHAHCIADNNVVF